MKWLWSRLNICRLTFLSAVLLVLWWGLPKLCLLKENDHGFLSSPEDTADLKRLLSARNESDVLCKCCSANQLPRDLLQEKACDVLLNDVLLNQQHGTSSKGPKQAHARSPPVRKGSFIYMSMASSSASNHSLGRACYPSSMVLFLAFKKPNQQSTKPGCRFRSIFFPKSTWTTGRNRLLTEAKAVEFGQGWKFEFFVFMDNDVMLIPSVTAPKEMAGSNGEMTFRELLLEFRPARSGISLSDMPLPPLDRFGYKCGRACFTDANVDAYHRSAVDAFLPYEYRLDGVSWWMAAYIQNMRFAALAAPHCAIFRQVEMDLRTADEHSNYPRASPFYLDGCDWRLARVHVARCFSQGRLPGFFENGSPLQANELKDRLEIGLFGESHHGVEVRCRKMGETVDYAKLLNI